jgi:hypothetical protein
MSMGMEVTNVVTAVIFMFSPLRIGKALIVAPRHGRRPRPARGAAANLISCGKLLFLLNKQLTKVCGGDNGPHDKIRPSVCNLPER